MKYILKALYYLVTLTVSIYTCQQDFYNALF